MSETFRSGDNKTFLNRGVLHSKMGQYPFRPSFEVGRFEIGSQSIDLEEPRLRMPGAFPLSVGRPTTASQSQLTVGFTKHAFVDHFRANFSPGPMYDSASNSLFLPVPVDLPQYLERMQAFIGFMDVSDDVATFLISQTSDARPSIIYEDGLFERALTNSDQSYKFQSGIAGDKPVGVVDVHLLFGDTSIGAGQYVRLNTGYGLSGSLPKSIPSLPLPAGPVFNSIQ